MSGFTNLVRIGLLLGIISFSGCTPVQNAILERGTEAVRQAKDSEAETLKVAVCAMSIGAFYRVNNDTEQRALAILCGGEGERPITADDIRRIQELGRLLSGS